MGDDSSSKSYSPNTTKLNDQKAHSLDMIEAETYDIETDNRSVRVLYSHAKAIELPNEDEMTVIHCDSFDKVLILLEEDLVEAIWFDDSVHQSERTYITGWAKIFRPDLKAQTLPPQKPLH